MKTVIEMARKSKLDIYGLGCPHDKFIECVEAFAELVRADERNATLEEIAKWLEDERDAPYWAELVRARSNT